MVDGVLVGGNPLAVLVVVPVVWIALRLIRGLLEQAGGKADRVNTSIEWKPGDDGGHHHGDWSHHGSDAAGDGGHGGDAGGHGGD